jgi:hypothetical protein
MRTAYVSRCPHYDDNRGVLLIRLICECDLIPESCGIEPVARYAGIVKCWHNGLRGRGSFLMVPPKIESGYRAGEHPPHRLQYSGSPYT